MTFPGQDASAGRSDVGDEAGDRPPATEEPAATAPSPAGWGLIDTRASDEVAVEPAEVPSAQPAPEYATRVNEVLDFERLMREVEQAVVAPRHDPPVVDESPAPPEAPPAVDDHSRLDDVLPEELPAQEEVAAIEPEGDVAFEDVLPEAFDPQPVAVVEEPRYREPAMQETMPRPPAGAARPGPGRQTEEPPARQQAARRAPAHRAKPGRVREPDRALVRMRSVIGLVVVVVFSGFALAAAVGLALAVVAFAARRAVGG